MKTNKANPKNQALFFKALALIRDDKEAKQFMLDLCTPSELEAMADRFRVVQLIAKKMSYRKIHEMTGVSVTTIGRVARALVLGEGGYQLIKKRFRKRRTI